MMLRKTILAGAALMAATFGTFAATSAPAEARVHVDVGIYVGGPGYYAPPPVYVPAYVYVPGYYRYGPRYRVVRHYRTVRYRPRWRKVCTTRVVKERFWNGWRWRWRTIRRSRTCRWVRRR